MCLPSAQSCGGKQLTCFIGVFMSCDDQAGYFPDKLRFTGGKECQVLQ